MSLRALARALGRSPSLLSAIETGASRPSVRTLYAICNELGLSLDVLFSPDDAVVPPTAKVVDSAIDSDGACPPYAIVESQAQVVGAPGTRLSRGYLVRAGSGPRLELDSGITWQRLNPVAEADIDVMLITYPPGAATGVRDRDSLMSHGGVEHGYVLHGELHLTLAFEEHVLRTGDAITFPADTPHRLANRSHDAVRALWTVVR
jgi:transcriptional regulator with XRE-family HTH domain/quercetin dioxygenase-like cupin family protein